MVRSTLRAAKWSGYLLVLVAVVSSTVARAQSDSSPTPQKQSPTDQSSAGERQEPGGQSSVDQSASPTSKDSVQQDSSQPDPNQKEDSKDTSQPPDHQSMMETVNSTMNATVEQMRKLPAQWFLGSYVPADRNLQPLTLEERRDVYIRQTYLTGASYLKRLVGAGIDQARGAPYEWGGGLGGYGKRFASRYGEFIIQNSLAATGNAILKYEPRYDYCKCTGFWPRTKHAIARNFVTYNETEYEKRWQIPLYVGAFGGGAIGTAAWRPSNENPWKEGAYSVASQAGFGVLSNWLQEFALDIGHKIAPKRRSRGGALLPEPGDVQGSSGSANSR